LLLNLAMLVDPRFKYDSRFKSFEEWKLLEKQLIDYAYESLTLNFF